MLREILDLEQILYIQGTKYLLGFNCCYLLC